jgi:hypothetical protein
VNTVGGVIEDPRRRLQFVHKAPSCVVTCVVKLKQSLHRPGVTQRVPGS